MDHTNITRISESKHLSPNETTTQRTKHEDYLTADGHVSIGHPSTNDASTVRSNKSTEYQQQQTLSSEQSPIAFTYIGSDKSSYRPIEISEKRKRHRKYLTTHDDVSTKAIPENESPVVKKFVRQSSRDNVEIVHVPKTEIHPTILQNNAAKNSQAYLTAQGHVIINVDKKNSAFVSSENGNTTSPDRNRQPFTEKPIIVTHINRNDIKSQYSPKEETIGKNQNYLTAHGHVHINRTSKDNLPFTTTNHGNSLKQNKVQQTIDSNIRISHVSENKADSPSLKNDIQKRKNEYLTAQDHVTVNSGIKSDSSALPTTEKDSTIENGPQKSINSQASVMHVNPNKIQNTSTNKNEVFEKHQNYTIAHSHVHVNRSSKTDIPTDYNEFKSRIEKDIQVINVSQIEVEHSPLKNDIVNRENKYLTAQGHVFVQRGGKSGSSIPPSIGNKSCNDSELKKILKTQVSVTRINLDEVALASACKEKPYAKSQEYLTANGHVHLGHATKADLANIQKGTKQLTEEHAKVENVKLSEYEALLPQSSASKRKYENSIAESHATVTKGGNTDASIPAPVFGAGTSGRERQIILKTQTNINHIRPDEVQLSSVHQEQTMKKDQEHLDATRHAHATIAGASKQDILTSKALGDLEALEKQDELAIKYISVHHIPKTHSKHIETPLKTGGVMKNKQEIPSISHNVNKPPISNEISDPIDVNNFSIEFSSVSNKMIE